VSRSVLVVGGSRGIGQAIVERFLLAGDLVAATSRGGGIPVSAALAVECDVTSAASVDGAFTAAEAAHGPVEVVVVNAGVTQDGLLIQMSEQSYLEVVDANLNGAWRIAKRAIRPMTKLKRGSFVFVSSVAGRTGSPGQVNYAAAKAGLDGLSRTVAREYASRNVRANVVSPGPTETDMTRVLTDEQRTRLIAEIPLGRLGTVAEIADGVHWVAGATFMTGTTVSIAGGLGIGY
jgi:3-oxoacyl-[acyl-carrier protein] reductase